MLLSIKSVGNDILLSLTVFTSLLVNRCGDFTSAISSLDFLKGRGLRAFTLGDCLIGPTKFFSFSQTQFNQLSLDFCLNSVGSCLVRRLFCKSTGKLSMSTFFTNHTLADFFNLVSAQNVRELRFHLFFNRVTGPPDCV